MALLQRRPCVTPKLCRSSDDVRRLRSFPSSLRCSAGSLHSKRIGRLLVSAQGENSESVSRNLTEEEARLVLGVSKETSFDEVVKVKNRLLLAPNLNQASVKEIQAAYDLLLMKSMTKRVEGSGEIPSSVRYADVQKRDLGKEARKALSQIPSGGIVIENPSSEILRANSIALGILALSILPQGVSPLTETYDVVPGVQLALAFVWSVYALRQYRLLGLGRAVGYTFAGLMAGGLLGGAIESVLHVQQHPLGGFHSPATLISEFSVVGIWACATFLG